MAVNPHTCSHLRPAPQLPRPPLFHPSAPEANTSRASRQFAILHAAVGALWAINEAVNLSISLIGCLYSIYIYCIMYLYLSLCNLTHCVISMPPLTRHVSMIDSRLIFEPFSYLDEFVLIYSFLSLTFPLEARGVVWSVATVGPFSLHRSAFTACLDWIIWTITEKIFN